MPKTTSGGPSNQHAALEPDHVLVTQNEDGNMVTVSQQVPIDAGEPEQETPQEPAEDPEVPGPPQTPQPPSEEPEEGSQGRDEASADETPEQKAARLQAELDALKGNG